MRWVRSDWPLVRALLTYLSTYPTKYPRVGPEFSLALRQR